LRFDFAGMALVPWFADAKAKLEKFEGKDAKGSGSAKVHCAPCEKQNARPSIFPHGKGEG